MESYINHAELISRLISAMRAVDDLVLQSKHIREDRFGLKDDQSCPPFDYSDPEAYLRDSDSVSLWDSYFDHLLNEWDADRLSEALLTWNIDRLTRSSAVLDDHGTILVRSYRRIRPQPESTIQGILARHASLNAFLNSAQVALEHWWKSEGVWYPHIT